MEYVLHFLIEKNQHTITICLLINQLKLKSEFNPLDMEGWGIDDNIAGEDNYMEESAPSKR